MPNKLKNVNHLEKKQQKQKTNRFSSNILALFPMCNAKMSIKVMQMFWQ